MRRNLMNELEFTCTQKKSSYDDGWNHPKAMEEATDENGNLLNIPDEDARETVEKAEDTVELYQKLYYSG